MVHHKALKCIQLLCCFIIFLLFLLFHCCWPEQSKQDGQGHAERLVWPHRMIGNTSLKNQWSKANARKWLQLKLQCEQVGQVPSESLVTRCHKCFSLLCLKLLRGWYALVVTLVFLSLSSQLCENACMHLYAVLQDPLPALSLWVLARHSMPWAWEPVSQHALRQLLKTVGPARSASLPPKIRRLNPLAQHATAQRNADSVKWSSSAASCVASKSEQFDTTADTIWAC